MCAQTHQCASAFMTSLCTSNSAGSSGSRGRGAVHFDHRAEVRGSRALIAHNVDGIGQKGRIHHVVGDQDAGRTGASLIHPQFLHQQAQTAGWEFIQRAEWLVQKQYVC